MIGHHVLVAHCHCLQDIFEVLHIMHHSLEEAMFSLESHRPNMHQGSKALNQAGIMLYIMMFGMKLKLRESFLQYLSVVTDFANKVVKCFIRK